MNKQGHLWITEKLLPSNMQRYRRWLLFGSILPDLLYHTYITGHTWEAAFQKSIRGMKWLECSGGLNRFSCLYLGYLLHYIEDFFTLPHNKAFHGNLLAHIVYERNFSEFLNDRYEVSSLTGHLCSMFVEDLEVKLKRLHADYEDGSSDFERDTKYMKEAVRQVLDYFAVVLFNNQRMFDAARLETFNAFFRQRYSKFHRQWYSSA